jgi:hypothetical protein
MRAQCCRVVVAGATAALMLQFSLVAKAQQGPVKAEFGESDIGANVSDTTIISGIPSARLERLVAAQKDQPSTHATADRLFQAANPAQQHHGQG